MSPNSPLTLAALFDDLNPQSANVEMADAASLEKTLKEKAGALEWTATSSMLVPKVAELLGVKLPDILVSFWEKADDVARALRESQQSPDEIIDVSLHDCSTEATLSPFIEVRIGGKSPGKRIGFTVTLPMTFKAVQLRIKGGALIDAAAGECEMAGRLELEGLTLAKLKNPVRIPLVKGWLRGEGKD